MWLSCSALRMCSVITASSSSVWVSSSASQPSPRSSAAHADRATGIPHYDSKFAIEEHLRASGVAWTVIALAAFMDNYATGWTLDGLRDGTFAWPMPADRPLTLICAEDIGAFAALALDRRAEFAGRRIDIAADELTPDRLAAAWLSPSTVRSRTTRSRSTTFAATPRIWPPCSINFATVGLDVDVRGLRRAYPDVAWHSFTDWADAQNWSALLAR